MTIDVARTVKKMFVDGKWVESESGELFDADSPATGEVIAQVPKGTRADADRAVEAAHRARGEMARLKGFERSKRLYRIAEAIERRRDEIAHLLTLDQGKPLKAEAFGEVDECIEYFKIAAEDLKRLEGRVLPSASPTKLVLARHYPRGVYGIITPWNWPLTMAAELIAPALAAGNAFVWTPASSTSVISVALMECIAEGDFPPGAANLVTGPGAEVGDEVAGHPLVDGVGFVGSTETGASVARRGAGKHLMLELGGNGPQVVFADADLAMAVEGAIVGCYLCAGQSCTAGERILVEEPVRDEFVARLADAARALRLGDPFADDTTLGPLNNEGVATKMDQHIADALKGGAKLVLGGERAEGFPTRLYYHATILDGVEPDMRVSREETFGPIAPIIRFKDEKQALQLANDSQYGLLGAVYTKDLSRALRFADALDTGWVNINESTNYWEAHLPFGGRAGKKSGIGRVGGRFALEQMTDLKTIVIEISPE
ncbi:MAG TPA: aldehyde dehydrogenase family protein [Candidatus Dormibacteraeota bacterium]|jgi:succinate-semialdehyde dehydrogenase/glutarate-semialdehyde dehydrogenase|nr:aldehyde dehydrogenase family protein [Candidatus Dormibacteraeota bacterium]